MSTGPTGNRWDHGIPCPPVTRTVPTTMPCAASSAARSRRFPAWVVGLVGLAGLVAGAAVAQLWRLLALVVVLGAVTGCEPRWEIIENSAGVTVCERTIVGRGDCYQCDTTVALRPRRFCDDAGHRHWRRACDAAGFEKAGAK